MNKMRLSARTWVFANKPDTHVFADMVGVSTKEVLEWHESPFWQTAVIYAEDEYKREQERNKDAPSGHRIDKDLLEQAVFLRLFGWSLKRIGKAIGRSHRTLERWVLTQAWAEMKEKVMLDKLKMHIFHQAVAVKDFLSAVVERQVKSKK